MKDNLALDKVSGQSKQSLPDMTIKKGTVRRIVIADADGNIIINRPLASSEEPQAVFDKINKEINNK